VTTDSQRAAERTGAPATPAPRLSLVLCSRNDQFQGDSLWRLETTLNHAARQAAALGRLEQVEIVVADWGSRQPLRDAVRLSEQAARIVRFVTVPLALAEEKQRDSRFAEVFAINAAARRSRGDYIGRIDQDTLVGRRFLAWFFAAIEGGGAGFPLDASVMISNRRRIPYHFAAATPPFPVVERYVSSFDRVLPRMALPLSDNYWECYIGILLMHRRLWEECGGYDESFIYYSYMEFDIFLRLATRYPGVDLGALVGHDFHHLDHVPSWLTWNATTRKENVMRTPDAPPPEFCPTGADWGLAGHPLAPEPVSGRIPVLAGREVEWSRSRWPLFARLTCVSSAMTVAMVFRDHIRMRGVIRGIASALAGSTGLRGLSGWRR